MGNGYRSYDPGEKCFQQPDAWSPFGLGGLNDRAYCTGDPVNWHDPSGHFMISRQGAASQLASLDEMIRDTAPPVHERAAWWEWVLLGVFTVIGVIAALMTGGAMMIFLLTILVISTILEIASLATRHTNPRLSKKLGYAALATGLADIAVAGFKKLGQGLIWVARRANQMRKAVKFHAVFKLARRSKIYVSHFDDITQIGSVSDKARAAGAASRLDNAFDIGSEARHIDGLVENSLGITTWGGKHMGFSALSPNKYNAGGVYATVDHYRVAHTIAKNSDEIADISSVAKQYSKAAKQHKNSQAIAQSSLMSDAADTLGRVHKKVAKQHAALRKLKAEHTQAFEQVTTLKGVHEELVGLRTYQEFHFQPNTASRFLGRDHGPDVPDLEQLLGTSRPSNRKEIYDELIGSLDALDLDLAPGGRVKSVLDDAAETAKHLHPDNYQVVHPLTGEVSTVQQLQDQYFRTTLNQEMANALGAQKKAALFNLANTIGDQKPVKKWWALAEAEKDVAKRHRMFREIHRELINSCASRHTIAVQRLEQANARLGAKAHVVHDLLDEQANAYKMFSDARANWFSSATGSVPEAKLAPLRMLETPMSTPQLRLNVYGHLDELGLQATISTRGQEVIHEMSAPRYGLRVSHWEDRTDAALKALEKKGLNEREMQEVTNRLGGNSPAVAQWWGPEQLHRQLIAKGLDPANFDQVRLVMCHGATGGDASFAKKFALTSNSSVKAFENSVTSTGFIEAAGSHHTNGLIEHMGHQSNAGALAKMESSYEGLVQQVTESGKTLGDITTEAGRSFNSVYLSLAKHNNAYNTYQPRYFSPLQDLVDSYKSAVPMRLPPI
ncbi:RHS repeat-associated core domain-containing protein [Pseudomonas sp. KNUC1026]|uniref:RHS repeat-associated core domain-containing protein n=1 Tax=Pseudomonas sp. KNUC1026 TaxID=2893890 RepID=UPI001F24C5B7|nr:RHS repeat-associated core domain-containing protein [Pseudomonas sp. KNUC1026]UFH51666.1 RHS repeat-associated core domain-containing protein [Pseudomonas sp. KNUC1026]